MKKVAIVLLLLVFAMPMFAQTVDVTFTVTDSTLAYENIKVKGTMTEWNLVQCYDDGTNGDATAGDHIWTAVVAVKDSVASYEWGAIEDDGSEWGIWLIVGNNLTFDMDGSGGYSGSTSYLIPPPASNEFLVTFVLNTSMMDNITDSTVTSVMVSGSYDGWKHDDTLAVNGDYCSLTIPIAGDPGTGVQFAFKHWYIDAVGTQKWESIADRNITVNSDTTILTYWDNNMPFTPTDDIDVWFRVNMEGVAGFDPTTQSVGIRGGAPLDWGNNFELTQEGDSYYYSGLFSFGNDLAGTTQEYKFVYTTDPIWESLDNRTFTLNADTTLAFKYFNNEAPTGQESVTHYVVFQVDMGAYIELGYFSEARKDSMQVRGGFNGWNDGDPLKSKMTKTPGTSIYTLAAEVTDFPDSEINYKYYMKLSQESLDYLKTVGIEDVVADWGYEVPPTMGGGNRGFTFTEGVAPQALEVEYYNGLASEGIIPEGTSIPVTFTVDMNYVEDFNAATDSVMFHFKDEWQVNAFGLRDSTLVYTDDNGDGIYELTLNWTGACAYTMIYTVSYDGPEGGIEEGGGFDFGRFRCRYIQPATKSPVTWPTSYAVPTDVFTIDPPLDVEPSPFGGVAVDDNEPQIVEEYQLSQNYPNPFNPITTINFQIKAAKNVTLTIYNMLGERVQEVSYKNMMTGYYNYQWNAVDMNGARVSSGVYLYKLQVDDQFTDMKKMILLK